MAAKAWYKPSAIPQLIAKFDAPSSTSSGKASKRSIEVWTTTCIVTNFGKMAAVNNSHGESAQLPRCAVLVNPANPGLTGPNSFPYFPRGGPQPSERHDERKGWHPVGYVSQWGGMDVGNGMLFSAEAIDGLVHQLGGLRLRAECKLVPNHEYAHAYLNQQATKPEVNTKDKDEIIDDMQSKCPVGTAVKTSSGGEGLQKHYDSIIHTTPPFYRYPPWETNELKLILGINEDDVAVDMNSWSRELLRSCYRQSFDLAFSNKSIRTGSGFLANAFRFFCANKQSDSDQQLMIRLAVPLLGAGCRDFPKEVALDVAALESAAWLSNLDETQAQNEDEDQCDAAVVFGLLEEDDAKSLSKKIQMLL